MIKILKKSKKKNSVHNGFKSYSKVPHWSMNPRPNITSYPVCIEDSGGNGGKSGFGKGLPNITSSGKL